MSAEMKIELPATRMIDVCGESTSRWYDAVWNAIDSALCRGWQLVGLAVIRHAMSYHAGRPKYRVTVRLTLLPGQARGKKPTLSPILALAPARRAPAHILN
jgi:hypothetical protein